jgi:hypothetical protein
MVSYKRLKRPTTGSCGRREQRSYLNETSLRQHRTAIALSKEAAVEFIVQYHDGFFEVKTFGDAEVEKFRDVLESLVTHEKWKPGTSFLINHTDLNSAPLTTDDMIEIAKINSRYSAKIGKSKCAHLLARDLEFGMARMWETFVQNKWDVSVSLFRSRDDAIAWLSC